MSLLDRFPSFHQLQTNSVTALRRFPLTLLCAILGTGIAIMMVEVSSEATRELLARPFLAIALGVPLFTALTLFVEKRQWRWPISFSCQGVGVVLLIAYYFLLPDEILSRPADLMRFGLLALGFHFLVACLPYIGGNQTHGFWQYNMALFHRFLNSALYSAVLFFGLGIALAAADHLFGLTVDEERYVQLWFVMAGIFNTWLFLAGIPEDLEALDRSPDYPKGLATFAQYILLPLVALYFVILIAYEAKIIITWNWPKGWVSELVLWFAVVGIVSLLALYPLRMQKEKRWVGTFVRWFFRALLPLVAMLFLAILRRISDYGVTEPRYLVLIMAIGLTLVVLYFIFSKARDIRVIPILLCVCALVAAYGPLSATAVSLWSQQSRLETVLARNGLLQAGSVQDAEHEVSPEDRQEMTSIIDYVCEWHGPEPFSKWLDEDVIDSLDTETRSSQRSQIAEMLGFEYQEPEPASYFDVYCGMGDDARISIAVAGYDHLVRFRHRNHVAFKRAFPLDSDSCFVSFDADSLVLKVQVGIDCNDTTGTLEFQLSAALDSLAAKYDGREAPASARTFIRSGSSFEVKFLLVNFTGIRDPDRLLISTFDGYLLLRRYPSD
jgi:hypothetical protein